MKNFKVKMLMLIVAMSVMVVSCDEKEDVKPQDANAVLKEKLQGEWLMTTVSINDGRSWTRDEICGMDIATTLGQEYLGWVSGMSFNFNENQVTQTVCFDSVTNDYIIKNENDVEITNRNTVVIYRVKKVAENYLELELISRTNRPTNPYQSIFKYSKQ